MKKVAILQSNYIPWKGYFDMIASVDEFVIFDDMQYTRRDWRNRNQVKTPHGVQWLTVPVLVKGRYHQKILDTKIDGEEWATHHWKALTQNYGKSRYFSDVSRWLEPIYLNEKFSHISKLNRRLIEAICAYLGITTKISDSCDYHLPNGKSSRLASICVQAGATQYLSGPSARDYIDESVFHANDIEVVWFDYAGYSEYPQLWGTFVHGVTVLDVIFNCGPEAVQLIRRGAQ